jgi:prepilin-type N-terminal cleavage/methylation domain-containing protein
MLQTIKKLKQDQKGFTIIEVLIVLAIAGLILLIVFLAVPALQRSQRNTGRKTDAGHISTAVNDFISNNSGQLPGNGLGTNGSTWKTDCQTMYGTSATTTGDAGTLSQYTYANGFSCSGNGLTTNGDANNFDEANGVQTLKALQAQAMVLDENAQCPTVAASPTPTSLSATTAQQAALFYTIEAGGGSNWNWACIQSE